MNLSTKQRLKDKENKLEVAKGEGLVRGMETLSLADVKILNVEEGINNRVAQYSTENYIP